MKKWWVGLLMMALVLIPSVAMAKIETGKMCEADCPRCGPGRAGFVISEINIRENDHWFNWICSSCSEQYEIIQPHDGGEATCSAKAKCEGCDAFYGEKNPNNHVGETFTTYEKISETQHMAKILCVCGHWALSLIHI